MVVISYSKTSTFGHKAKEQIDDVVKFSEETDNNIISHMRHFTRDVMTLEKYRLTGSVPRAFFTT